MCNSFVSIPSKEQRIPSHLLSSNSNWALFKLNVSRMAFVAKFASNLSSAVLAHGRMPVTTWRIGAVSPRYRILLLGSTELSSFLSDGKENFRLLSIFAFEFGAGERRSSFSPLRFASVSSSECIMTETTWVSFWTLSSCFPLIAISHLPLNVGFLSFLTPGYCSPINHFVSFDQDRVWQMSSI